MFVRWKTTKRANGNVMHTAQLVEAVRVEGKPRQKVRAHLGSYTEVAPLEERYRAFYDTWTDEDKAERRVEYEKDAEMARTMFWQVWDDRTEAQVPGEMRDTIYNALSARVPRPVDDIDTYHGSLMRRRLGKRYRHA